MCIQGAYVGRGLGLVELVCVKMDARRRPYTSVWPGLQTHPRKGQHRAWAPALMLSDTRTETHASARTETMSRYLLNKNGNGRSGASCGMPLVGATPGLRTGRRRWPTRRPPTLQQKCVWRWAFPSLKQFDHWKKSPNPNRTWLSGLCRGAGMKFVQWPSLVSVPWFPTVLPTVYDHVHRTSIKKAACAKRPGMHTLNWRPCRGTRILATRTVHVCFRQQSVIPHRLFGQ